MRYESLKKHGDQWVRIRPALQVYDDSAVLKDTIEDAWWMHQLTEETVKLQSRDTQHLREIGLDQVYGFMRDPEGRAWGTEGILQLNVQLLLFEGRLLVEPTAPPGKPLERFVPARTRESLYSAASRMAAQVALDNRRKEYAWSRAGVDAAAAAFAEFEAAYRKLGAELRAEGHPVDMVTKRWNNAILLGALGWWVRFSWNLVAGNHIEGAMLNVEKFHGHPEWPGIMTIERARRITVDQYTFSLVTMNEARWISRSNSSQSYTTLDLATKVLKDLLERPNQPKAFFDLG